MRRVATHFLAPPHRGRRSRAGPRGPALVFVTALLCALPAVADEGAIPVVNGFTPASGAPGTIVKIAGENLDQVVSIEFEGGAAASFTLFSSSMLKAAVPAAAQTGRILLRSANGGAWTPSSFRVIHPPAGGLGLAPPSPNPGPGPFRIAYNVPAARAVDLDVMDVRGRRVRRLVHGVVAPGPHVELWDGRDAGGQRAAPGLYFVMLRLEDGHRTRRLVVID